MVMRKTIGTVAGDHGKGSRPRGMIRKLIGTTGAALALAAAMGCAGSLHAAPADPVGKPQTSQQAPLDASQVIGSQMRMEKSGNRTGMFSAGFKAAYDAVPRDEDNLNVSILGSGYDVPDKVVKVSDLRYDDATGVRRAFATATLHFTNPDAPIPSFNRNVVVALVPEGGQWKIDDVRLIGVETAADRKSGKEVWIRRGIESLADDRARLADGKANPACSLPTPVFSRPDRRAMSAGFRPLTDLTTHAGDPNRKTIADKFADAIGSACPFAFQLVDLNGDGLYDLVLQLSDTKLGATSSGLRRTAAYILDREGKWKPMIDGLSRDVLVRRDRTGAYEVALSGNTGDGYKAWRWTGTSFAPVQAAGR